MFTEERQKYLKQIEDMQLECNQSNTQFQQASKELEEMKQRLSTSMQNMGKTKMELDGL